VRETGEAQAGGKGADREHDGADDGWLPQTKGCKKAMHNPSMYPGGRGENAAQPFVQGDRLCEPRAGIPNTPNPPGESKEVNHANRESL